MKASALLDTLGVDDPPEPDVPPDPAPVATLALVVVVVGRVVVVVAAPVVVVVVVAAVVVVVDAIVVVVAGAVVVVGATVAVVVVTDPIVVDVEVGADDVVVVVVVGFDRDRMRPAPDASDPAAKHAVVEGHVMCVTTAVTAGTTWGVQVAPPSPEPKISPPPEVSTEVAASRRVPAALAPVAVAGAVAARSSAASPESPGAPTAMAPARRAPAWRRAGSDATACPRKELLEVAKPVKTTPVPPPPVSRERGGWPAAKQMVVVGTQATLSSGPALDGKATDCHVVPPSAVVRATGPKST